MVGYKTLVASDPVEQEMRTAWHAAKDAGNWEAKRAIERKLSDYIWNRVQKVIEEDRKKHPKAKRNLPVGSEGGGGGRFLP